MKAQTESSRNPKKTDNRAAGRVDFDPVRVLEVELSEPLPSVPAVDEQTGVHYRKAVALVRLHSQTMGVVELVLGEAGLTSPEYADQIWRGLGSAIVEHLKQDGLPETATLGATGLPAPARPKCVQERDALSASAPLVSIVVATRDRASSLADSLGSLLALDYPNYEIIVVDNAPSDSATADLVREKYANRANIRYVREDFPGLGSARNRGLAEVRGEIVAFTDDDVVADRYWLRELVKNFDTAGRVGGVTGLVFAAELETPAQVWFDQTSRWSARLVRRVYDLSENRPDNLLYPYSTGAFGAGASMAFRASVLREIGGFDPALGVGTATRGGEDLAAYFEIVTRGYRIVYEPSAIVHHKHRRAYAALQKQMYGYGSGLTAYLTKLLVDKPWRILDLARRIPPGLVYALSSRSSRNQQRSPDFPLELVSAERKGMLHGPLLYLKSRWQARHAPRIQPAQRVPATPDFQPVRVLEVELSGPLSDVPALDERTGRGYRQAMSLVRLHTQTLGVAKFELGDDGLTAQEYADQIWRALGPAIVDHLREEGLPEVTRLDATGLLGSSTPKCLLRRQEMLANAPFVSVIVATHDRPATLAGALDSLLDLNYPNYEIIVVDNAPSTSATADLVNQRYGGELKIRYLREDRPGPAAARNRGLTEANGSLIAFTDDDVTVDRHWLAELVETFEKADNVGAVTGLAFAAELETPSQVWFEETAGWSGRLDRGILDVFDNRPRSPFFPYSCGMVGTGANVAYRAAVLKEIGGFDPHLGAGTPSLNGEDIALFFEVLVRGYRMIYEPSAIVHHYHRRDYASLRKQMFSYGAGLTAYLTKVMMDKPSRILDFAARLPVAVPYALRSGSPLVVAPSSSFPRELTNLERRGLLFGPIGYLRSRWQRPIIQVSVDGLEPPVGKTHRPSPV